MLGMVAVPLSQVFVGILYSVLFLLSLPRVPYCQAHVIRLDCDLSISLTQLLREDFLNLRMEDCFCSVPLGTLDFEHTNLNLQLVLFGPLGNLNLGCFLWGRSGFLLLTWRLPVFNTWGGGS